MLTKKAQQDSLDKYDNHKPKRTYILPRRDAIYAVGMDVFTGIPMSKNNTMAVYARHSQLPMKQMGTGADGCDHYFTQKQSVIDAAYEYWSIFHESFYCG